MYPMDSGGESYVDADPNF